MGVEAHHPAVSWSMRRQAHTRKVLGYLLKRCPTVQEESLQGNPVDRHSLEQLRPESFSSILILADDTEHWDMNTSSLNTANIADADSRCLASLLLLRDIQSSRMHYGSARQTGMDCRTLPVKLCLTYYKACLKSGKSHAKSMVYMHHAPLSM